MPIPTKGKETCQEYVSKIIQLEIKAGREPKQAAAIAYSKAREAGCSFPIPKK